MPFVSEQDAPKPPEQELQVTPKVTPQTPVAEPAQLQPYTPAAPEPVASKPATPAPGAYVTPENIDDYDDDHWTVTHSRKADEYWKSLSNLDLTKKVISFLDKNRAFSDRVWDELIAPRIDYKKLAEAIEASDNKFFVINSIQYLPKEFITEELEKSIVYSFSFTEVLTYVKLGKTRNPDLVLKEILRRVTKSYSVGRDLEEVAHYINKIPNLDPNIIFDWLIANPNIITYDPQTIWLLIKNSNLASPNYVSAINKAILDFSNKHDSYSNYISFLAKGIELNYGIEYGLDPNSFIIELMSTKNTNAILNATKLMSDHMDLNKIQSFMLEHGETYDLEQLCDVPGIDVRAIQYKFQERGADDGLETICGKSEFDINSFQNYVVSNNKYGALLNVMDWYHNNAPERIGQFNIPTLQRFIESKKDNQALEKLYSFIRNDRSFNFKAFKTKFNEWAKQELSSRTETDIISSIGSRLSRLNDEDHTEAMVLYDDLLAKKDLYFILRNPLKNFFDNFFIDKYRRAKGKTYSQLFNESFKNSYSNYLKLENFFTFQRRYQTEFVELVTWEADFFDNLALKSNNLDQYLNYVDRAMYVVKLMHNSEITLNLAKAIISNTKLNLDDKTNVELIEAIGWLESKKDKLADLINKAIQTNSNLIDANQIKQDMEILLKLKNIILSGQSPSFKRGSPEYSAVKNLHVSFALLEDLQTVRRYISEAKPKVPELFKLGMTLPGGFEFRVLKYLDPYAFRMGAETDCCQRIGGAGEDAAIDSFINPLAGVLILTYNDLLLAQSYFHYVPEHKGIILDNVEWNKKNCSAASLTSTHLSKIFADYAAALKNTNPEISYIRCGKDHNKLDNSMFTTSKFKEEDPRHFEVDSPYSDFDEDDHLDLLAPKQNLASIQLPVKTAHKRLLRKKLATAISISFVRRLALKNLISRG